MPSHTTHFPNGEDFFALFHSLYPGFKDNVSLKKRHIVLKLHSK